MDSHSSDRAIFFAGHTFFPDRCELRRDDDKCVILGFRAALVLEALLRAGGRALSQRDLLAQVWPGREVHEANLRVQIGALRKALPGGHDIIRTINGRGYVFTEQARAESNSVCRAPATYPCTGLPSPLAPMIGRGAELELLPQRLAQRRLLTLVGSAGIGKTMLAAELARRISGPPGKKKYWVELDGLTEADRTVDLVAAALRMSRRGTAADLATYIGTRNVLLVLDNCEHVADECEELSSELLRRCPGLQILATSRRPLLAQAEDVYRVPALEFPAPGEQDITALTRCTAVQLFLARARAADSRFNPDQRALSTIGAICVQLDGIPLAIELAAAGVHGLGIDHIAARLNESLDLLRSGRRTAPARQRTLSAALDWSIRLLSEPCRRALYQLAGSAGWVSAAAAHKLLASAGVERPCIGECLDWLIKNSLLIGDPVHRPARFRLLATTRTYLLEERSPP